VGIGISNSGWLRESLSVRVADEADQVAAERDAVRDAHFCAQTQLGPKIRIMLVVAREDRVARARRDRHVGCAEADAAKAVDLGRCPAG